MYHIHMYIYIYVYLHVIDMYVIHNVYTHACLSTDAYVTFNIYSFYDSIYVYMYLCISIS